MKYIKNNTGISLIVLIITIIVIIILAGTVILSLTQNNPIKQATEAAFKASMGEYESELTLWFAKEYLSNGGLLDIATVNATKYTGTYNNLKIKDIIKNIKPEHEELFEIQLGKLTYIGPEDYGEIGEGNDGQVVPIDVVAGLWHTVVLMSDGTVKAWGANWSGQLGNGTTEDSNIPITIPGLMNVKQLAAGEEHTLALLNDGTIKAWGSNYYGQLGDGTWNDRHVPAVVPNVTNVKKIYTKEDHTFVLLNDGTVKAWGYNGSGELGNGITGDSCVPVTVISEPIDIYELLDLDIDGQWSENFNTNSIKIQFTSDGSVTDLGYIIRKIRYIENGQTFEEMLAEPIINLNYGNNENKIYEISIPSATSISVNFALLVLENGWDYLKILDSSDEVLASYTGRVYSDSLSLLQNSPPLTNVKELFAGNYHTLALLNDGTVKAWGGNWCGQLGDGTWDDRYAPILLSGLTNVKHISAGGHHTVALLNDGTVKAWGCSYNGQVGIGIDGDDIYVPTVVPGLTNVSQVFAGSYHTLALLNDGTVKAWGANWSGQLGDGTTEERTVPISVMNLTNVQKISAGEEHTLVLLNDSVIKAWGSSEYGQVGNGTFDEILHPVTISIITD